MKMSWKWVQHRSVGKRKIYLKLQQHFHILPLLWGQSTSASSQLPSTEMFVFVEQNTFNCDEQ